METDYRKTKFFHLWTKYLLLLKAIFFSPIVSFGLMLKKKLHEIREDTISLHKSFLISSDPVMG